MGQNTSETLQQTSQNHGETSPGYVQNFVSHSSSAGGNHDNYAFHSNTQSSDPCGVHHRDLSHAAVNKSDNKAYVMQSDILNSDFVSNESTRSSQNRDEEEIARYTRNVRDPERILVKPCDICSVRYTDNYSPWDHCFSHAWGCNMCDFTTYSRDHLHVHCRKEHRETENNISKNVFFCLFCMQQYIDHEFPDAENWLKAHLADKHLHEKTRYRCRVKGCNIKGKWTFRSSDELIKHERMTHINDSGRYFLERTVEDLFHFKCEVCPMVLFSLDGFANHSRSHARENVDENCANPMATSIIDKETSSYNMSKEKENVCRLCHERFEENYSLWDHSRMHVWCCLDCPFTAEDIHMLKAHRIASKHLSEPQHSSGYFFCLMCMEKVDSFADNKYFNAVDFLDSHKREFHVDMRTVYSCKLCKFTVSRENSLRLIQHEKLDHNDVLETNSKHFQCKTCKRLVLSSIKLEEHVLTTHSNYLYGEKVTVKPDDSDPNNKPSTEAGKSGSTKKVYGKPGISNFKCEFCDDSFEQRFGRGKHLLQAHGSDVELNFVTQRRYLNTTRRRLKRQVKKYDYKQKRSRNR